MLEIVFMLLAIGDTHAPLFLERAVSEMNRTEISVDVVVHAGDLTEFPEQMAGAHRASASLPWLFVPVPGNHDDLEAFTRNFGWTPRSWVVREEPERVIVVALDSNRRTEAQLEFLSRKILMDEEAFFVIVLHHPPVPCSGVLLSGTSRRWREGLEGMLRSKDLVIAGHGHAECSARLECGALVLMTALGCRKRYPCADPQPAGSSCASPRKYGYLRVHLLESEEWTWERVSYGS